MRDKHKSTIIDRPQLSVGLLWLILMAEAALGQPWLPGALQQIAEQVIGTCFWGSPDNQAGGRATPLGGPSRTAPDQPSQRSGAAPPVGREYPARRTELSRGKTEGTCLSGMYLRADGEIQKRGAEVCLPSIREALAHQCCMGLLRGVFSCTIMVPGDRRHNGANHAIRHWQAMEGDRHWLGCRGRQPLGSVGCALNHPFLPSVS